MNNLISGNMNLEFSWNPHLVFNLSKLIDDKTTFLNQEPTDSRIRLDYFNPDFLYKNQYLTFNENELNETRLKLQEGFARQLILCIKEQHFEYGVTSMADQLVSEQMNINALATKNTINKLFIDNYNKPDIVIGLLQVVSRITVEQINPEGYTMATAAISHENHEVKETAIRCLENWGDKKALEILQSISVDIAWLQDYVNSIINDIQEELCLT